MNPNQPPLRQPQPNTPRLAKEKKTKKLWQRREKKHENKSKITQYFFFFFWSGYIKQKGPFFSPETLGREREPKVEMTGVAGCWSAIPTWCFRMTACCLRISFS